MPLPAILVGAAVVVGGLGIKKGLDAKEDFETAKRISEKAELKYKRAEREIETARQKTQDALSFLGEMKALVFRTQINHMVKVIKQRKNARSELKNFEEDFSVENLQQMESMVQQSFEIEKGLGSAAVGGGMAAFGAYGTVGMLATASTGTAISTLSGAAATNATLAWLGGGSLAAGGFGVAGGMVALGGIALGPALAIGGFIMASKGEQAKTDAYRYEAKVDRAVEELRTAETVLKGIRTAAAEQAGVIKSLVIRFEKVKVANADDDAAYQRMLHIGTSLVSVLRIPVLQEDGKANPYIHRELSGYLNTDDMA